MKKILLQTTIAYAKDDWSIERFSILTDVLSTIRDASGSPLFHVTARDRENLASGDARVVALGRSVATGNLFNIAVAFERNGRGRAVVDSSFHHFLDYNLDPRYGCPSFVTEPSRSGMLENPQALADTKAYIENIARWLAE